MSAAKENPCRKFQANIFNKSKCQNCFKPRESHLLNDEDLTQAKPIYGGWLLLAPDGTDFDNPVHRSRKWQRRFFILYEHGLLRYALDEMPTTLPQGTINMNQCTDVVDGEGRTGQKFSLCVLTPDKEHFIRAETKEIISGWLEMLMVYPRTNKQNQKKKRKVEPPTPQEPGPAKVAVTASSSIPSAEKVPTTKSTLWQEELRAKDQPDGSSLSPAQSPGQSQPPAAGALKEPGLEGRDEDSSLSGDCVDCGRKVRVESGYFSLEKTKQDVKTEDLPPPMSPPSPSTPNNRRSQVIEKFEALDIEKAEHMETNLSVGPSPSSDTRQGRSEKRAFLRKRDLPSEAPTAPLPDASASPLSPHRRAKSLDRRSTESSLTPDLLNFKKGWLTKQYEDGQWKKHWFVLADQSLRYYRDSVAEEAADLDGEIDLSTCYDVTEYPVQRNYGFQIHTKEGEFTLSAMTSGIRRNWIQTIMKHVHPASAPDVTNSLPEEKSRSSSFETCPRPGDRPEAEAGEPDPEQKRSRARERRREGRSKTFDWAEFRPLQQALAQERARPAGPPAACPEEPGELERERARRREERRKRFGGLDAVDAPGLDDTALRMEVDRSPALPATPDARTQSVHVEIEQRWHQVETTPLREEKQVPIAPLHLSCEDGDDRPAPHELTSLLEKELEQSQKEASDLLEQNRLLQDQLRVALGREQSAREGYVLQTEVAASPPGAWERPPRGSPDLPRKLEAPALTRSYGEAADTLRHHEAEVHSLQARLSRAAAELATKEQALTKLRGDLELEKDQARERLAERQHSEAMLSSRLQASEQKLRSAEALLRARTRELQELQAQRTLQGGLPEEAAGLRERMAELSPGEQTQRLMEERLQQSCVEDWPRLPPRPGGAEGQLQAQGQRGEVRPAEPSGTGEAGLQALAEHVQSLRDERNLLRQRFQELTARLAVTDGDLAALQEQLRGREAELQGLERSCRAAAGQLQAAHALILEKEEELRCIRETHERALERKDQDLNEALVKMVALGSSLEETEMKLQAKEEMLRRFAGASSEEPTGEDGGRRSGPGAARGEGRVDGSSRRDSRSEGPDGEGHPPAAARPAQGAPGSKRQRIRFSTIQCQTYSQPDAPGRAWASSTSSEDSLASEAAPSSLPAAGDPDTYLSVIHALETKLYITEEKLRDVTARLESEQGQSREALLALRRQWAGAEVQLREQLHASLLQVRALAAQLDRERQARVEPVESPAAPLGGCPEPLRHAAWSGPEDAQGAASPLARVEGTLLSALQALRHCPAPADGGALAGLEEAGAASPQPPELTEQQQRKLLSEQIALEASLIDQIADSLRETTAGVSRILHEVPRAAEGPLGVGGAAVLPAAPADAWAKKVLVEGEFWSQVAFLSEHLGSAAAGGQQSVPQALVPALADATWVRAELSLAVQSARESFQRRLHRVKETLRGTQAALQQHKCMLGEVLGAYRTPNLEAVMQRVSEALQLPAGAAGIAQAWDPSPAEDTGSSQEPCWPNQSSGALAQEELALQLKDKAGLLREMAAALTSLPTGKPLGGCWELLRASHTLSYDSCVGGLSQYSSSLVKDAIVQAQVCYAACRIRLQCEKALQGYKEAWQSGGATGALRGECQELLQQQEREYLEVVAGVERENAELKAQLARRDTLHRSLQEGEGALGEGSCALQGRRPEGLQPVLELQAQHTRVLSQLDASVRDRQDLERQHEAQMRTLEGRFQHKVQELQAIHAEEMRALQEHYARGVRHLQDTLQQLQARGPEALPAPGPQPPPSSRPRVAERAAAAVTGLQERIQELEAQTQAMREQLQLRALEGSAAALRDKYQRDFESLKATCERGFAAMEETHQKKIEDLQRQHQRELEKLREEKDRLLAEETAATISAIEAMKNAHREEMERELEKSQRSQISSINADVEALRRQYLEELQSVQRELEVLSEQYSQKCLENAHLAQALEAERQALRQCQRENQELNAHNQELNNRLAAEIARLRTLLTGDAGGEAAASPLTQGKDAYELEVLLRVKESEIQYLKQEISSLKDELQTALRDKKYASDKYKDIYTELSIVRAKADCDVSRLKEQLEAATEALGEKPPDSPPVSGYDIMKSKSNPDFLKKDRSCVSRQLRSIRSKSLKEGLTVQERLKLFQSRDLKKD